MKKDQVLFYLNRIKKNLEIPSQEELAKQGASYETRKRFEEQREVIAPEREAVSLAIDILGDIPDHDAAWGE